MKLRTIISTLLLTLSTASYAASLPPVQAKSGMVVSSQHLASQVGVDVLKQGGNAIDAAVAVGYTLAVVHPCCGNIGGGGFMLIHLANGKNTFINFRETAPLAIKQSLFDNHQGVASSKKIQTGYLSVGIPGTVKGLNLALKEYGTMPLTKLIQPAINYAQQGYVLTHGDVDILNGALKKLKTSPESSKIFTNNGKPYQAGDLLKQPQLAESLKLIQQKGDAGFYQGKTAEAIVKASDEHGGVISLKDFSHYKAEELTPVSCHYRGYTIESAPPPSSGGATLCEMLNVLKAYPLSYLGYHSAQGSHYIIEAMRYAYADRNQYLGDPDFVKNPIDKLLSEKHALYINSQISRNEAGNSQHIGIKLSTGEQPETTHYSIVDKYGNAVAVTYTLNGLFGNGQVAGNTGILMNNEMDDFTLKPGIPNMFGLIQGEANAIKPGKRPLSSMTPTIVLKNNKVHMVLGAPGGSTIITQVLLTILNVIDYHMDIQQAINAPRFHMQWLPDHVYIEPYTFSVDTIKLLNNMGYRFKHASPYGSKYWGAMAAILIDNKTHTNYGAIDARRPAGAATGY